MINLKETSKSRIELIYASYGCIFLVLTAGFAGIEVWLTGVSSLSGWVITLFALLLLVLAGLFTRTLEQENRRKENALNEMVAGAINGQPRRTAYSEHAGGALENTIIRYIERTNTYGQKAEEEKKKIQMLLSDISHQTKTPLANIALYTGLLEETSALGDEERQYIVQLKEQSAKLNWLIESLIKMSRLETGILSIRPIQAPVTDSVSRAISQVYALAEQKGMEIRTDGVRDTQANHDVKWTAEALFNILENAVKYSPPGSTIRLSAETNEMFTRIDIADSGIGIKESEWNAIFKRFYRCPETAAEEGVGIGLYLAREILTAQGGYITVASTPGEGSTFSVYLPNN